MALPAVENELQYYPVIARDKTPSSYVKCNIPFCDRRCRRRNTRLLPRNPIANHRPWTPNGPQAASARTPLAYSCLAISGAARPRAAVKDS
jgi:hypothetical protein